MQRRLAIALAATFLPAAAASASAGSAVPASSAVSAASSSSAAASTSTASPSALGPARPGPAWTRSLEQEASRFVLSTLLLGKIARANTELLTLVEREPDVLPGLPLGGDASLEQAVRVLEAAPRVRATITATGLSLRDYVLAHAAIRQAKLLAQVRRHAATDRADPDYPHANVAFVREHPSEIDALVAQWGTLAIAATPPE